MRSFRIFTVGIFALALSLVCTHSTAVAQKKDKNSPPVVKLEATPLTPYSNVKRENLLNGLQLVTLERTADPVIKCDIVVRAGSMFDLMGKTGLAALTQTSLLAANPRLKEELESLQAKIDWGINSDTTWYHIETPFSNFDSVFEIVSRLLVVENVRPEAFKVAQEDLIKKIKTNSPPPAERAEASFLKALYGDHPYGHNVDGTEASVASIKQGDVYDFLKRFYIANNVSVTVIGPVSQERVLRTFKVFFGGWSKGQIVPGTFRQPAQVTQLRVIKLAIPEATATEFQGGVIGIKYTDADFPVTEVLARVLETRLKRTAEARAVAVTSSRRVLSGPFSFSASVDPEKAQEFSQKATAEFAAVTANPLSPEELAAAKAFLAGEYGARSVDNYLREIEAFGFPRDYPLKIQARIDAITAADVQRVAKRLLDANALTLVVAGRVDEPVKSTP